MTLIITLVWAFVLGLSLAHEWGIFSTVMIGVCAVTSILMLCALKRAEEV
jgi:hypothetical protein